MRFTTQDIIKIATGAEARSENPKYMNIMKKFDRVLNGETKCARLNMNEKDLISSMFESPEWDKKIYG